MSQISQQITPSINDNDISISLKIFLSNPIDRSDFRTFGSVKNEKLKQAKNEFPKQKNEKRQNIERKIKTGSVTN